MSRSLKCLQKSEVLIMGTVIVLAVLVLIVGLIVRSMIRDKKNGKSLQCGGSCSGCGGHCHCSAGDGSSGRS